MAHSAAHIFGDTGIYTGRDVDNFLFTVGFNSKFSHKKILQNYNSIDVFQLTP